MLTLRTAACAALTVAVLRRMSSAPADVHGFVFARVKIREPDIFYRSPSSGSVAISNLRPVLPGHSLVVPRRPAARLADLTAAERADLFDAVRAAQGSIAGQLGATAFNLAVSDGPAAGQPVPHLHVHVVPRRPGDLAENDVVHELIAGWSPAEGLPRGRPALEVPADDRRVPRTPEAMSLEAAGYASRAAAVGGTLPAAEGPPIKFGKYDVRPSSAFYASPSGLSLAIVNLKPLVPGHVLVIPRRVVPLLGDLTPEELRDLWGTVCQVQAVVQDAHGADSSNLGVQDGVDAGQTVAHVHVHILPIGPAAQ